MQKITSLDAKDKRLLAELDNNSRASLSELAKKIKEYVNGGGFLFAMCSATDSYDIALASEGTDICAQMFDGDGADPSAQKKLDFSKTLAFKDFLLIKNPNQCRTTHLHKLTCKFLYQ